MAIAYPCGRSKSRAWTSTTPAAGRCGAKGIARWFVDTDYNDASFFVRQAYFPCARSNPYQALKTTLNAEVDAEAWASLRIDASGHSPARRRGASPSR